MINTPIQTAVLEANQLTVGYGRLAILENLNLNLKQGQMTCLLGPNGVGKSTLLRTLTGMQPPLQGQLMLHGSSLNALSGKALAQQLGVVLTERPDVGELSTYGLVALGRHPYTGWLGHLSQTDHEVIQHALTAVGASHLADHSFDQLSDGQRQKVMIARALAQEPAVLILDEPTAFLDLPHRVEVMQLLKQLAHQDDRAILLTTHDLNLALHYADTLWLITADRTITVGSPEDLVLNGALKQAFPAFDEATGGFTPATDTVRKASIMLQGAAESTAYFWTKRALQRAGYSLTEDGVQSLVVEVEQSENRVVWSVEGRRFESVSQLLAYLAESA